MAEEAQHHFSRFVKLVNSDGEIVLNELVADL